MIKRKIKCAECKNRKFASLNDGVIRKHLQGIAPNGTDVVGIYPMTEDECCYFLAMKRMINISQLRAGGWTECVRH